LNRPDLDNLPGFPGDQDGPHFNEPWEAQAFALTLAMYEKGMFDWPQWSQMLGEVIARDKGQSKYYELWLVALERMVGENKVLSVSEISARKAEWQRALASTPHGQPIALPDEG